MTPDRLARRDAVARDDLLVAALLLRVEQIPTHRERRPPGTNRPSPHLHRRRRRPVGADAHVLHHTVAIRTAEARPLRRAEVARRRRRRFTGLLAVLDRRA